MVIGFALALGLGFFVISGATSNTEAEVIEIDGEGEQRRPAKKRLMRAVRHDTHDANLAESERSQENMASEDFPHADEARNEHEASSHAFEAQGKASMAKKRTRRVLLDNHHANQGSPELSQEKILSEAFPHAHDEPKNEELSREVSNAEDQGKASLAQQSDEDELEEFSEDESDQEEHDSLDELEDRVAENGDWIHIIVNAIDRRRRWNWRRRTPCVFLDWTYLGPCTDSCMRAGERAQKEFRPKYGPFVYGKPCIGRHERWVECYKSGPNSVPVCPMVEKPDKATTPEPLAPFTTVGWPLCTGKCT